MNFSEMKYEKSQFPIQIWTDGACSGNPGPGGAAAVIRYPDGTIEELTWHEDKTTNQQMEIMAVDIALDKLTMRDLPSKYISIFSDSAYVCNCINQKWYEKWKKNGWINSKKEPVRNKNLWEFMITAIDILKDRGYSIEFVKVPGHSGNTWNEKVDRLAVLASKGEI